MAKDIIGLPISKEISNQIKARQELVRSKNDSTALTFFNGNGTWVRLMSSVNEISKDEYIQLLGGGPSLPTGTSELAKNNILTGGTVKYNSDTDSTSKHVAGIGSTKLYRPTEKGYRPAPGITSLEVKSKGTMGSLQEAVVGLRVNSLQDLENIQKLYLRPGYTVLLEWGHSLGLTSKSENKELIKTPLKFSEYEWFTCNLSDEKIQSKLKELNSINEGNAEHLHGYVTNFSWQFTSDGGYECTLKIISRGLILDSIQAVSDPADTYNSEKESTTSVDGADKEDSKENFSIFHKLHKVLEDHHSEQEELAIVYVNSAPQLTSFFEDDYFSIHKTAKFEIDNNTQSSDYFLSIKTILGIFNKHLSTFSSNSANNKAPLVKFYTGQGEKNTKEFLKRCKFNTSEKATHFSILPHQVLLPGTNSKISVIKPHGIGNLEFSNVTLQRFEKTLISVNSGKTIDTSRSIKSFVGSRESRGEFDDILNIHISLNTILDLIEGIISSSEPDLHNKFTLVLAELLKLVDKATGTTALSLFAEDNTYYILDQSITHLVAGDNNTKSQDDSRESLQLTGLSSIVSDVQMSSKLSNRIQNQVATAAQGVGGNTAEHIGTLLNWNRNLIDRHKQYASTKGKPSPIAALENKLVKKLEKFQVQVNKSFKVLRNDGKINTQTFNSLVTAHKEYTKLYVIKEFSPSVYDPTTGLVVRKGTAQKKVYLSSETGVVPIDLTFTMQGIGGLKVGEVIKLKPGVLPTYIIENYGFIITGLTQKVDQNKWNTEVTTQFYLLKK